MICKSNGELHRLFAIGVSVIRRSRKICIAPRYVKDTASALPPFQDGAILGIPDADAAIEGTRGKESTTA